jgi:hypothetical protein
VDDLFLTLFGQLPGTDTGTQVLLHAVGSLLTGVALLLLARRNDLGWWAQILAVFAGPLVIALRFGYEGLVAALPLMGAAGYGLWRFSRYPLVGKFGRDVEVRGFSVGSLAWGVVLVGLFTALKLGPMLSTGFIFSAGTSAIWMALALESVVVAGLVGVAHGLRWAWLAIAAAAVGYIAVLFGNQPALATLGLLVFQFGTALFGWWSWRQLPADVAGVGQHEADSYPPSPYSS